MVNSREDKLAGSMWRRAFDERRCVIPASAFYEWVALRGKNVPLRFERPGNDWLWIAGIWEDNPTFGRCFSMITTDPNTAVEPVHDRMPAVLREEQIQPYLENQLNDFGPSGVLLQFQEADNFLKVDKAKEEPKQLTLFEEQDSL